MNRQTPAKREVEIAAMKEFEARKGVTRCVGGAARGAERAMIRPGGKARRSGFSATALARGKSHD